MILLKYSLFIYMLSNKRFQLCITSYQGCIVFFWYDENMFIYKKERFLFL